MPNLAIKVNGQYILDIIYSYYLDMFASNYNANFKHVSYNYSLYMMKRCENVKTLYIFVTYFCRVTSNRMKIGCLIQLQIKRKVFLYIMFNGKNNTKCILMILYPFKHNKINVYLRSLQKYAFLRVCGAKNIHYTFTEAHKKFRYVMV